MGSKSVKKVLVDHPHTSAATSAPDLSKELLKEWRSHVGVSAKAPAQQPKAEIPKKDTTELTPADPVKDDPFSTTDDDTAVEDIIKKEGDEVIAAEDAASQAVPEPPKPKKHRVRKALGIIFFLLLLGGAVAMTLPNSRYFILNTAGVRSKVSVVVLDSQTRLPLKNVTVTTGGSKAVTNTAGQAVVPDVKLGKQTLTIKRVAFSKVQQNITVGWGSNPLGEFLLKATGVQYTIKAHDYISGASISGVEARSGEAVATAADDGTLTLTLEDTESDMIPLTLTAKDYRTETTSFSAAQQKPVEVNMVPATKSVFVKYQSGRYDLVSMFIDGKEQKTILPGTGSESANTSLAVDHAGAQAALVSHRDDLRGAQGQKVNTLSLVAVDGSASQALARAEHITLVDWIGTALIFQESNTTGNADDPERYKLISYDYATNKRVQLAAANQFNSVLSVKGQVYYAPTGGDPKNPPAFYQVNSDGTGRKTIVNQEVWTAVRTAYDRILLQMPSGWMAYTLGGGIQASSQPESFASRYYAEGSNQQSIWIAAQGGDSTLMNHDTVSGKDTVIATRRGMAYPLRWLTNNSVVARVVSDGETADYAISLDGGVFKKIADVVNTYGVNRQ